MQKTRVQSLGLEDPLEKGMATHSSILVWTIPWTEEPSGLQSMGYAPNAGGPGSIPVQGTRSHMPQLSSNAATEDPVYSN